MRTKRIGILLIILISMEATKAFAYYYDFAVENEDGVIFYYKLILDDTEVSVVSAKNCKGHVEIPSEVMYKNVNRKVTDIYSNAFQGRSDMTSVTIPNGVTYIGGNAFERCNGLTSVIIPNSVTCIYNEAFQSCTSLSSVTIGNGVTYIGNFAFGYCSSLTSVTIPNSVGYMGYAVFICCSALTSVTIGNSITRISDSSFRFCSGLTSITIPNSVTSIRYAAFEGCSGLTSVTIPNSVTSISEEAFQGCSALTSVTIPNSVTSIGERAFDNADISTVISFIENPFEIDGKSSKATTFSLNTFNNATLYVPKGTIDKYKATKGWKDFLFIEEGLPSNITSIEDNNNKELKYYGIDGKMVNTPQKGIRIIKLDDGTTRKVLVR